MVLLTPSIEDIINSFVESVRTTIPEMSTTPLSVTREVLINPSSSQLSSLFTLAKDVSKLQDVFEATGSDLDTLAESYGLFRRSGTPATGVLLVDLTQLENRDTIRIPSGTVVTSSGGAIGGTSFFITSSFTFSVTSRASFEAIASSFRSELDSLGLSNVRLAATIPIQATSPGLSGNVGAFVLNSASISGISNVINISPSAGGTNDESDNLLRNRIIARFTGNSVGSEASLLAAALSSPSILSGFTVLPGDPLMTRDGTVRDAQGNIIQAGTGRSVDIYVLGTSLNSNSETQTFIQNDLDDILSVDNAITIGQPGTGATFGFLPIFSTTSVVGEESGATFVQGAPVTDAEGNILIEGNYALIKDVDSENFSIVENLVTGERKLATFVNPSTSVYTTVEEFTPSDFTNSALSKDKIIFLKNEVDVEDETITRGEFNGADQLQFSNVTNISTVYQDEEIAETIRVESFQEVPGGVAITTKHTPVISVTSIRNTRLGLTYTTEIIDADAGTILIAGRVPPLAGDFLALTYTWRHFFQEDLNFSLVGDHIDWVGFADEKGRVDSVLLAPESLQSQNTLSAQPNIPSYLQFSMTGVSARQIVETTITGTVINFHENQLALMTDQSFRFANTGLSSIGRLFKVSNVSRGYDYNLAGYKLQSNRFDPTVGVDTTLLAQQFQLSERANTDLLEPGDKLVLSRPSRTLALTTQADFENNIEDNLAPIFDPTAVSFTLGGAILNTPLLDEATSATTLAGLITQDLTLSGIVEVTDDLIISEGVVVDIEPSTLIKIRPSDQLESRITFSQKIKFDLDLVQEDTVGLSILPYEEFTYLFFKPTNFASSFFVIINDEGQTLSIRFEKDILTKVIEDGTDIVFYVNGTRVPSTFNTDLESTIDLDDINTSIKATFLGARTGVDGDPQFISALVESQNKFYSLLEKTPVVTSNLLSDFTLAVEADSTFAFERFSYNETLNAILVDGNVLEVDGYGDTTSATDYLLTHFVEEPRRLSIIVEGTLRVVGATPQTSVLFTSAGAENSAEGDWEGITFTPKSHSNNSATIFRSTLNNTRIRYANNGISVNASDVEITNCIVRDCLDVGVSVASTLRAVAQFSGTGTGVTFNLNFSAFSSVSRKGFLASDGLQLARYPIPESVVTSLGELPTFREQLTETSYVVNLIEGVDFTVYLDLQRAISIDTTIPSDNIADHALVAGTDFLVEFDINTGYSLVFLYTTSPKLRRVYDLIVDLQSINRPGSITIDFFATVRNGVIFDNLILNTAVGISLSSLATLAINRNTIHNNRIGINVQSSILNIRNNSITGFSSIGIVSDSGSYVQVQRNDIYSELITSAEQVAIADRDILLKSVGALDITLLVRTPNKFKVGSTVKIDSEEMLVQGINEDSIIVSRAYNGTAFASHSSGSEISLFQLNQIFTVTGVDGEVCQLIETDSVGVALPQSVPIEMRQITQNTFRAVFPINRRVDFYYKYRFSNRGDPVTTDTETKVFLRSQPGVGVNDIISIFHELPLSYAEYVPNMENFSTDPLYANVPAADFSVPALSSLTSSQHPLYGSLSQPNPLHRLVGYLEVRITVVLNSGVTRVPVFSPPLIVSSLIEEVTIIGINTNNLGVLQTPSSFSTSITGDEADNGAVGVFILDTAVTLSQSGQYQVSYRRPIDLGTTFPPYYLEGDISYVFDVGSEVTFDTLSFTKDEVGGDVEFNFNVAATTSALSASPTSITTSTSPVLIGELGNNIGSVLQANIKLLGNDSSFSDSLVVVFPILQDFALTYTPAKDIQEYKVLSLQRDRVQNLTNILIDAPISTDTFNRVGQDSELEVFARKKSDSFDPALEFLIANSEAVTIGDTFVSAKGDLLTAKPAPSSLDVIRVDYMSTTTGAEQIHFIANGGDQITSNIYSEVDSITSLINRDGAAVLPSIEQIGVVSKTQPNSGSSYQASYLFEAPLEGETLTINYIYNEAIRTASSQVELKKSLFTDVQVRQSTSIPVRVAITLEVTSNAAPLAVQTEVSNAIAQLFAGLVDITTTRRIDPSDIVRATSDIAGIEDIQVTTLSSNLITGEVVTLIFQKRESPVLESGSPRINTSQNGRAIQIGSS